MKVEILPECDGSTTSCLQPADVVLEQLMQARYSCRSFLPEAVPVRVIERITGIAQRTASWCNVQPWSVLITSGAATERFRSALMQHDAANQRDSDFPFPKEYQGVYLDRRRKCGAQLHQSVGISRQDKGARSSQARENFRFFGAPHVAIVTAPASLGVYGAVDCGAYVNSFLLAAQSMGVATVAQAALAAHSVFVRNFWQIGDDRRVVCGISFGYAAKDHPINAFRTDRASVPDVVRWVDR